MHDVFEAAVERVDGYWVGRERDLSDVNFVGVERE